jgi:hypothetical protein
MYVTLPESSRTNARSFLLVFCRGQQFTLSDLAPILHGCSWLGLPCLSQTVSAFEKLAMRWITCRGDLLPKVHFAPIAEVTARDRSVNPPPLLKEIRAPPINQDD